MISRTDLPHVGLIRAEVQGATTTEELHRALALGATIPDRVSADPASPDYSPEWSPRVEEVRWNGQVLTDVVAFDHVAGWVEQVVRVRKVGRVRVPLAVPEVRRREGRIEVTLRLPMGRAA